MFVGFIVGFLLVVALLWALSAAPAISSTLVSSLTITETPAVFGGSGSLTIAPMNETQALSASTTPAVTAAASFQQALSGGAATIDLTSLPGLETTDTVSFNTLKVQQMKLQNPSTNANKIVASNGATNPYRLDGATTAWIITLAPGQSVLLNLANAGDTVGSSHKTIDLAGTGSQALNVEMTAG